MTNDTPAPSGPRRPTQRQWRTNRTTRRLELVTDRWLAELMPAEWSPANAESPQGAPVSRPDAVSQPSGAA
jgi:hypothetical protein